MAVVLVLSPAMASAQSLADTTKSGPAQGAEAAQAAVCPKSEDWMTSGDYLPQVAECLLGPKSPDPDPRRVALVQDIQIKAGSYSLLNKVMFWVAIGLALGLLLWPSYVAVHAGRAAARKKKDADAPEHWTQRATTTSAIQTSIAALAALSFAFYAHYKGNQVKAENLMREIIFTDEIGPERIGEVLSVIAEMDKGFGFTTVEALQGK